MARTKRVKVKGLNDVLRNFKKAVDFTDDNVRKGLQAAGLFVKTESKKHTPHDKGVLMNSAYYSTGKVGSGWVVRIGYTAKYAPYVHEMPASFNFSKPDTGPKFLFNAIFNNEANILRIIANRVKL